MPTQRARRARALTHDVLQEHAEDQKAVRTLNAIARRFENAREPVNELHFQIHEQLSAIRLACDRIEATMTIAAVAASPTTRTDFSPSDRIEATMTIAAVSASPTTTVDFSLSTTGVIAATALSATPLAIRLATMPTTVDIAATDAPTIGRSLPVASAMTATASIFTSPNQPAAVIATGLDVAGGVSPTTATVKNPTSAASAMDATAPSVPALSIAEAAPTSAPASVNLEEDSSAEATANSLQSLIERYIKSSTTAEHKAVLEEAALLKLSAKEKEVFFEGVAEKGGLIVAVLSGRFRRAGKRSEERREIRKQIKVFGLGGLFEFALPPGGRSTA
jgi:hypothetical protein